VVSQALAQERSVENVLETPGTTSSFDTAASYLEAFSGLWDVYLIQLVLMHPAKNLKFIRGSTEAELSRAFKSLELVLPT
jgi:hypothetical protein